MAIVYKKFFFLGSDRIMELGFLINPIAGMGGRVGLKGTDGVVDKAKKLGASPVAPERGREFLRELKRKCEEEGTSIRLNTCPGIMGEEEAKDAGFDYDLLPMEIEEETSAKDTKKAIRLLLDRDVDLIAFVGGDGTARDVYDAMHDNTAEIPILGIPSGVKMYSGLFTIRPEDAADLVIAYKQGRAGLSEFEVMDANETSIREDQFEINFYGVLKGPFQPMKVQGRKQASPNTETERENQMNIARYIFEQMEEDGNYILGPGTTVQSITELLELDKTLLGVDIYTSDKIVLDVSEKEILDLIDNWQKTWIIVSPIGNQGILFGRGNQQISPKIIDKVGKKHIIVISTKNKIQSIKDNIFRVDTGNKNIDEMLTGYIKVIIGYKEWRLIQVK